MTQESDRLRGHPRLIGKTELRQKDVWFDLPHHHSVNTSDVYLAKG